MNKVLTISLGGNAYQLEEAAYETLRSYLDEAHATLAGDPDRAEIMQDLEQAVAERLDRCMHAHKSVANKSDVEHILAEMGPVNTAQSEEASETTKRGSAPKRLYRLTGDQKMIFGVCAGIAAYANVDVTIVRVITVVLLLATGGGVGLAYVAAALLIPKAVTPEEQEAAHGTRPLTARDIVESTRKGYQAAMGEYQKWSTQSKQEWRAGEPELRRKRKREQRWWRHQSHMHYSYAPRVYPRGPGAVGEVAQVLFLGLIIYLLYTYVPQSDPFFNYVWHLMQQGWSWIFSKLTLPAS